MVQFKTTLKKFQKQGEKTGWTYVEVPADLAQKLKAGNRKEFKVKGKLDKLALKRVSLLPMGGGQFIMPVNAEMRKAIGKRHGAMVVLQLIEDKSEFVFNKDFMDCLADEASANDFFKSLPGSHQRYFSKWIDSVKSEEIRARRIAQALVGLSRKQNFGEMLRALKKEKDEWK